MKNIDCLLASSITLEDQYIHGKCLLVQRTVRLIASVNSLQLDLNHLCLLQAVRVFQAFSFVQIPLLFQLPSSPPLPKIRSKNIFKRNKTKKGIQYKNSKLKVYSIPN